MKLCATLPRPLCVVCAVCAVRIGFFWFSFHIVVVVCMALLCVSFEVRDSTPSAHERSVLQIWRVTVELNLFLSSVELRWCFEECSRTDSTIHTQTHTETVSSPSSMWRQDYVRCGPTVASGGVTKHWTEEIRIEFRKFIVYLLSVWVRFWIHLHKHIEHTHTRWHIPSAIARTQSVHIHSMAHVHSIQWHCTRISIFRIIEGRKQQQRGQKTRRKKHLIPSCTVWLGTWVKCGCACVCVRAIRDNFKSGEKFCTWESRWYIHFRMKNDKF